MADREQLRPFGGAVDLDASQYIGRLPGARLVDVRSRRLCLNAIEATQHRRVKDRAPNAYDQQQAAQRRASEIAMAQQQQAVMAQQTSPARVLIHRSPSSRYRCGDDIASMACGTRRDRTP